MAEAQQNALPGSDSSQMAVPRFLLAEPRPLEKIIRFVVNSGSTPKLLSCAAQCDVNWWPIPQVI